MKIILALIFGFFVNGCLPEQNTNIETNKYKLIIKTASNESYQFDIELAVTRKDIMQGLMHRTELPENAGMLFYFGGREAERSFWMKNTLISLDMLFIRKNGQIHHIHENAIPEDLTGISSNGPVAAVLEINGGVSQLLGIRPGDEVLHPFFQKETNH